MYDWEQEGIKNIFIQPCRISQSFLNELNPSRIQRLVSIYRIVEWTFASFLVREITKI